MLAEGAGGKRYSPKGAADSYRKVRAIGLRSKELIGDVIGRKVAPLPKGAGFRKAGLRLHTVTSEVDQVIEFQPSQANFADPVRFGAHPARPART